MIELDYTYKTSLKWFNHIKVISIEREKVSTKKRKTIIKNANSFLNEKKTEVWSLNDDDDFAFGFVWKNSFQLKKKKKSSEHSKATKTAALPSHYIATLFHTHTHTHSLSHTHWVSSIVNRGNKNNETQVGQIRNRTNFFFLPVFFTRIKLTTFQGGTKEEVTFSESGKKWTNYVNSEK